MDAYLGVRLLHIVSATILFGTGIDECRSLMRLWIALGGPAFSAVLVLFWLMVYKPWIEQTAFGA